jgi:hypothetical protein
MEVAHAYRVPYSQFLEWDQGDRDKAAWMVIREQETCGGCGTRAEEWDPARGGSRAAYLAEESLCPGCAALGARQKASRKLHGEKPPLGLKIRLKPAPPSPAPTT